jgi:hypothetical protein
VKIETETDIPALTPRERGREDGLGARGMSVGFGGFVGWGMGGLFGFWSSVGDASVGRGVSLDVEVLDDSLVDVDVEEDVLVVEVADDSVLLVAVLCPNVVFSLSLSPLSLPPPPPPPLLDPAALHALLNLFFASCSSS